MALSNEDREALLRAWPWPSEAATTRDGFGDLTAAVEAIVARAVTAALNETADAIDEMVASSKSPVAGEDWHGFVLGYACSRTDAARIIRTAARGAR